MAGSEDVTQLLSRWSQGDRAALDQLTPLVYSELRGLARRYLSRERSDHTLQSTALVHEAYLRLVDQRQMQWQNRTHFFSVAAEMARRVLVDHARARNAQKRGEGLKVSLDDVAEPFAHRTPDLIALDDALNELAKLDTQQAKIVELRFFGGLTIEETAEILGISTATVKRDWLTARAFLQREISRTDPQSPAP